MYCYLKVILGKNNWEIWYNYNLNQSIELLGLNELLFKLICFIYVIFLKSIVIIGFNSKFIKLNKLKNI